jgi:hypothetical protein
MNFKEKIKDNIVKRIPYDIEKEEVREIVEIALSSVLENYKNLIKLHESILNNDNLLNSFKDLVVEEIKKGDVDV